MVIAAFSLFYTVKANPSFFIRANNLVCGNFTATTSIAYLRFGIGTTTPTFDTGCAAAGSADSSVLAIQLTGSSTATTLNINFEYSQDGIDWYGGPATTTTSATVLATTYSLAFASTTFAGAVGTGNGIIYRLIAVPTPMRYVRAVETLPSGSTNGAVWAEFIAKRQNP